MTKILERAAPAPAAPPLDGWGLLVVLAVAAVATTWWPAWRVLRPAVTLVHELGHAVVGVAAGRRFTGFVLRSDMSGHAVTVGPPRGPGAVATTWAGYPAPAVLGGLLVWLALRGWSAPALTVLLVGLVLSLLYARSLLTGLVVVGVMTGVGALWWWRDDAVQTQMLTGVGLLLLVGAWRHLAAVVRGPSPTSDPAVLAASTRVPAGLWLASFVLVMGLATWPVVVGVLAMLTG